MYLITFWRYHHSENAASQKKSPEAMPTSLEYSIAGYEANTFCIQQPLGFPDGTLSNGGSDTANTERVLEHIS
jgi:hypothetical protein